MILNLENPIKAIYNHISNIHDSVMPTSEKLECEIIAESEHQYKIKITQQSSRLLGRIMWVRKHNVYYKKTRTRYYSHNELLKDCSNEWWQEL